MIYFIRQSSDFVKIGYTKNNLNDRLVQLQTGNPDELTILVGIEGDEETERRLHAKFVNYLHRGEWYFYSNEIADWVGEVSKTDMLVYRGWSESGVECDKRNHLALVGK